MKSILIFITLIISSVLAQVKYEGGPPPVVAEHDGRPGCHIRYEFTRFWRNNFIPEQYWECTKWQQPARVRHCPVGTRFQDTWQTCVRFHEWEWTPYSETPTKQECEELILEDECKVTTESPVTQTTTTTETTMYPETSTTTETLTTPETTRSTTEEPQVTTTTTTGIPCPCEQETTTTTTTTTTQSPCPCLPEVPTTTEEVITTTTQQPIASCLGASENQHSPGAVDCSQVPAAEACNLATNNVRLPTRDPYVYYECNPLAGWVLRSCSLVTCFDGSLGICIGARFWNNVCRA